MDVADETLVSIYGTLDKDGDGKLIPLPVFMNLKAELKLDEDVGSGRVDGEGGDDEP